jgi:hypothetical protein
MHFRFRRHSGHPGLDRWLNPVANDPERASVLAPALAGFSPSGRIRWLWPLRRGYQHRRDNHSDGGQSQHKHDNTEWRIVTHWRKPVRCNFLRIGPRAAQCSQKPSALLYSVPSERPRGTTTLSVIDGCRKWGGDRAIVPQRNASLWSKLLIHENLTNRDSAIRSGRHHSSQCRPLAHRVISLRCGTWSLWGHSGH